MAWRLAFLMPLFLLPLGPPLPPKFFLFFVLSSASPASGATRSGAGRIVCSPSMYLSGEKSPPSRVHLAETLCKPRSRRSESRRCSSRRTVAPPSPWSPRSAQCTIGSRRRTRPTASRRRPSRLPPRAARGQGWCSRSERQSSGRARPSPLCPRSSVSPARAPLSRRCRGGW